MPTGRWGSSWRDPSEVAEEQRRNKPRGHHRVTAAALATTGPRPSTGVLRVASADRATPTSRMPRHESRTGTAASRLAELLPRPRSAPPDTVAPVRNDALVEAAADLIKHSQKCRRHTEEICRKALRELVLVKRSIVAKEALFEAEARGDSVAATRARRELKVASIEKDAVIEARSTMRSELVRIGDMEKRQKAAAVKKGESMTQVGQANKLLQRSSKRESDVWSPPPLRRDRPVASSAPVRTKRPPKSPTIQAAAKWSAEKRKQADVLTSQGESFMAAHTLTAAEAAVEGERQRTAARTLAMEQTRSELKTTTICTTTSGHDQNFMAKSVDQDTVDSAAEREEKLRALSQKFLDETREVATSLVGQS